MSNVVCCFCAESIAEEPVEIIVPVEDEGTQALWSHARCLGTRLHPSVPTLLPAEPRESVVLNEQQAYLALFTFLEAQFKSTGSEELGVLLGSLQLLPDGGPADPAIKAEWSAAVAAVLGGCANANFKSQKVR